MGGVCRLLRLSLHVYFCLTLTSGRAGGCGVGGDSCTSRGGFQLLRVFKVIFTNSSFSSFVCPFSLIKVLPRGVLMGKGGLGRIGGRNGREEVGEGGERTQDKNVMSGL